MRQGTRSLQVYKAPCEYDSSKHSKVLVRKEEARREEASFPDRCYLQQPKQKSKLDVTLTA